MPATTSDTPEASTVEVVDAGDRAQVVSPGEHAHPGEGTYYIVALVLGGLTAIEVGLYYVHAGLTYIPLLLLMALKFVIVAGFFMHLRFDNKAFRQLFTVGLILAGFCYGSVLLMFGVLHF